MRFMNRIGWFTVLMLRGLLLWILIPYAFLTWSLVHVWRQKASLKQSISWYDRNMMVAIINGPFRFLLQTDQRLRFVRLVDMGSIDPHVIIWLGIRP